jgi:hypothetical protein
MFLEVGIIEEIFGITGLSRDVDQLELPEDPFAFASVQTFPKEVEDDVLYFLHSFITEVLDNLRSETLFIIVLDNASLLDRASWSLLKLLYHSCP